MDGWLFSFDPSPLLRTASRGAACAELFLEDTIAYSVSIEDGEVESAGAQETRGIAARSVAPDGGVRLAAATGLAHEDALACAAAVAGTGRPRVSPPGEVEVVRSVLERPPSAISVRTRVELAQSAHRAAKGASRRVTHVRVFLRDGLRRTSVAHSSGAFRGAELARALLGVEVIAQDGARVEAAFESIGGEGGLARLSLEAVTATARIAAQRAVALLKAPPAPAGLMPVVLGAEAGGTFVHEAVGHPLEADLVLDGVSVFEGRVGQRIASPLITVVDDPTAVGHNGSFVIDDEGTSAQRTVLIERGVLRSYLCDRRSGMLLGQATTGNARRESYRARPIVRMSNTMIVPGAHDPKAILRETSRGLYVARMGGGEVDTVTGHFVFEAAEAYLIEDGELGPLVRGATLTGETEAVLASVDRVGSDLGMGIGTCGKEGQDVPIADGEPTIRIPALVVGGAG